MFIPLQIPTKQGFSSQMTLWFPLHSSLQFLCSVWCHGLSRVALSNLTCPQNLCLDIASSARLTTQSVEHCPLSVSSVHNRSHSREPQSRKFTPQRWGNMTWLGNIIAMWNRFHRGRNLYTKQRQNMTWTKYQSKTIISHYRMCSWPIRSM